ncbi:MAG: hypothetical protein ACKVS8_13720 [Phycisphaerales bacterium]
MLTKALPVRAIGTRSRARLAHWLGVLVVGTAGAGARAQLIKNLEFNTPGALPSHDPDFRYFAAAGTAENSVFSVADGLLRQRLVGRHDNCAYDYGFGQAVSQGNLDPSRPLVMEARVKILQLSCPTIPGTFFQALNGATRYLVGFRQDGISINRGSGPPEFIACDVSQFHTYRIESPACNAEYRLYIDGVLQRVVDPVLTTANGFNLVAGEFDSDCEGDADWDYLRVTQAEVVPAVAFLASPQSLTLCPGEAAAFCAAPGGLGAFTYQWQIASPGEPLVWADLSDGNLVLAPGRERVVTGATSPMVQFGFGGADDAQDATVRLVRCVVSAFCGSSPSGVATFTIDTCAPSCRLDYNLDTVVNPDDLGDFITDYYTAPPVPGPGGFAIPCPGNEVPYDAGYKAAYTPDGAGQCIPPFPDNLGDFITDYYGVGC